MVTILKKRNGLNYAEVWFPDDNWKKVKSDIIRLHCIEDACGLKAEDLELQHTRLTDLTQSVDQLKKNITSTTFRCIRRSDHDRITVKHFSSEEVIKAPRIIHDFADCYHAMFQEKGMVMNLDEAAIMNCAKADALIISVAYLDQDPVVYHSYIDGKARTICWHSCSKCRNEKDIANTIGAANKRLHWEDWLFFKARGCAVYDWGGVFAFDSENGIDRFKTLFGGTPHDYYHTMPLPNSLLGKFSLKIYAFLSSVQSKMLKRTWDGCASAHPEKNTAPVSARF